MKNIFLVLIVVLIAISCCDDEQPHCGGSEPIKELPWLKARIESIEDDNDLYAKNNFIQQSVYQGKTVFLFNICCASCNYTIRVFDCEGESLGFLGNGEEGITFSILDNAVTLWEQDDFACVQ